jgi:flagellar hook-length control protein FliK
MPLVVMDVKPQTLFKFITTQAVQLSDKIQTEAIPATQLSDEAFAEAARAEQPEKNVELKQSEDLMPQEVAMNAALALVAQTLQTVGRMPESAQNGGVHIDTVDSVNNFDSVEAAAKGLSLPNASVAETDFSDIYKLDSAMKTSEMATILTVSKDSVASVPETIQLPNQETESTGVVEKIAITAKPVEPEALQTLATTSVDSPVHLPAATSSLGTVKSVNSSTKAEPTPEARIFTETPSLKQPLATPPPKAAQAEPQAQVQAMPQGTATPKGIETAQVKTEAVPQDIATPKGTETAQVKTEAVPQDIATPKGTETTQVKTVAVPQDIATPKGTETAQVKTEALPQDTATPKGTETTQVKTEALPQDTATPKGTETTQVKTVAVPQDIATPKGTETTQVKTEAAPQDPATPKGTETTQVKAEAVPQDPATPKGTETAQVKTEAMPEDTATPKDVATPKLWATVTPQTSLIPAPSVHTVLSTHEVSASSQTSSPAATSAVPSTPAPPTTPIQQIMEAYSRPFIAVVKTNNGREVVPEQPIQQQTPVTANVKSAANAENVIPGAIKAITASTTSEDFLSEDKSPSDQAMNGQVHQLSLQRIKTETVAAAPPVVTVGASGVAEQVVKQVSDHFARHEIKTGSEQIVLRLSPENLGELKVNLRMENQRLTVEIVTENRMVRDAILQNSDTLKDALARQNIKMDSFNVSSGSNGDDGLAGRDGRNQNEWQELTRNRQATKWLQSEYNLPKDFIPEKLAYNQQAEYGMLNVHF